MGEKSDKPVTPIIEGRGITHVFPSKKGDVVALEAFDLAVRPGEFCVIVGSSGCGKTTFLNLVAGFLRPTEGEILLHGTPVTGVEPRCTMIFQHFALFPWKTVLGNVAFGPRMRRVRREDRFGLARRYIDMVGLAGFEDAYPAQLSGGMQQRVALCRALANEPEVLLCDEPFAALDAMTRQVMQEELLRIAEESHKTVLFITHSIDEALILADRVIVMSARPGRVKVVMENDLPRPRRVEVQLSEDFQRRKREIWGAVEEEVREAMQRGV
ncbi:MAG: ABC transporter ATP-binding protein [Planctomycetota bacterium]